MKNYIFILIVFLFTAVNVHSQVTIGSGKHPESYSILEMDYNEGGIRLNQLDDEAKGNVTTKLNNSTADKKNLTNGLTIFDTKANKIQYWDGNGWAQSLAVEANENAEGVDGQLLMSNGSGKYPEWVAVNIPKVQKGELYLYSSAVKKDMKGVNLPFIKENWEQYEEDQLLNSLESPNWVELKDLETKITIPQVPIDEDDPDKVYTRLVLEMQTSAQMKIGPQTIKTKVKDIEDSNIEKIITIRDFSWISFGIGIFIGNQQDGYKLKQVRSMRLEGSAANSFSIYTVIGAVDNLLPGEHTIKVAVKRRSHATFLRGLGNDLTLMTVGKPFPGVDNNSNFMSQSFLRADLYIIYE